MLLLVGWQSSQFALEDRVATLEGQVAIHDSIIATLIYLYLPTQESFITPSDQPTFTIVALSTQTPALTSTLFYEECWITLRAVNIRNQPTIKAPIGAIVPKSVKVNSVARHYDELGNLWIQTDYRQIRNGFMATIYNGVSLMQFINKGACR